MAISEALTWNENYAKKQERERKEGKNCFAIYMSSK